MKGIMLKLMFILRELKKTLMWSITLYVDDLVLAFNDLALLKKIKDNLLKIQNDGFRWDPILLGDTNK